MRKAPRSLASAFGTALLLSLLAPSPGVLAEEAQAPKTEHATKQDKLESQETEPSRLPPTAITSHTTRLNGQSLHYSAIAGTVPLHEKGKTAAEIFYVAYVKKPKDTRRPVTFVFNGGPGAASAYLHLGAIGPKIVEATDNGELIGPPPRLIDNDASWLAFTDLVFVDPVGTGYSRALNGASESDFWGVEQDTASLAELIVGKLLSSTSRARLVSSNAASKLQALLESMPFIFKRSLYASARSFFIGNLRNISADTSITFFPV